jgi:hypothetical protein
MAYALIISENKEDLKEISFDSQVGDSFKYYCDTDLVVAYSSLYDKKIDYSLIADFFTITQEVVNCDKTDFSPYVLSNISKFLCENIGLYFRLHYN